MTTSIHSSKVSQIHGAKETQTNLCGGEVLQQPTTLDGDLQRTRVLAANIANSHIQIPSKSRLLHIVNYQH